MLAQEEARLLGQGFIGTEHILLGLLHQDGGVGRVLVELGASLPTVREKVADTIGLAGGAVGSPPFTPRAKKVLELSLREALQLGHHTIGPEHLLLGLVREGEGVGCQILIGLPVDLADLRQHVMRRLAAAGEERSPDRPSFPTSAAVPGGSSAKVVVCSFCGLAAPESGRLVAGDNAFICERCILRWSVRLGPRSPRAGYTWVSRALDVVPTGIEPEGADAARAQIRAAFVASRVPGGDGRSVPSVERGDDLGPTLVLANESARGLVGDGSDVVISADEIHFLDPTRAVVLFSIAMGHRLLLGGQRGEAVLLDGTWKMARSTFCHLMGLAGVSCPPTSD